MPRSVPPNAESNSRNVTYPVTFDVNPQRPAVRIQITVNGYNSVQFQLRDRRGLHFEDVIND